jgi:hypothetical protein
MVNRLIQITTMNTMKIPHNAGTAINGRLFSDIFCLIAASIIYSPFDSIIDSIAV